MTDDNPFQIRTVDEMIAAGEAEVAAKRAAIAERGLVKMTPTGFLFSTGYELGFDDDLSTTRDTLDWIYHLNGKTWWTPQMQADFIWLFMHTFDYPTTNDLRRLEAKD